MDNASREITSLAEVYPRAFVSQLTWKALDSIEGLQNPPFNRGFRIQQFMTLCLVGSLRQTAPQRKNESEQKVRERLIGARASVRMQRRILKPILGGAIIELYSRGILQIGGTAINIVKPYPVQRKLPAIDANGPERQVDRWRAWSQNGNSMSIVFDAIGGQVE